MSINEVKTVNSAEFIVQPITMELETQNQLSATVTQNIAPLSRI